MIARSNAGKHDSNWETEGFGERVKSGKACPNFGGNENMSSLEEKFDSGEITLHVLSIP
jgi:hypothetical protein